MNDQGSLFPLPDPGRPWQGKAFAGAPDTTRAAARLVTPRTGTQRRVVLEAIAARPQTDEELQRGLVMSPNTQRPRRVELVEQGWVCDSGQRRRTTLGDRAIVWTLTPAAWAQGLG